MKVQFEITVMGMADVARNIRGSSDRFANGVGKQPCGSQ